MDFLVRRPIAVIMAFLAFAIIGIATYTSLPVSLLPDIAIPQITVQMSDANMSARELETSVVSRVRQQLLQVGGLDEIGKSMGLQIKCQKSEIFEKMHRI